MRQATALRALMTLRRAHHVRTYEIVRAAEESVGDPGLVHAALELDRQLVTRELTGIEAENQDDPVVRDACEALRRHIDPRTTFWRHLTALREWK